METAREQPSPNVLSRLLRRWRDFENLMEARPEDRLESRVADLEKQIADLGSAPNPARPPHAREV